MQKVGAWYFMEAQISGKVLFQEGKRRIQKTFIDSNESILVVNKGTSCVRSLIEES